MKETAEVKMEVKKAGKTDPNAETGLLRADPVLLGCAADTGQASSQKNIDHNSKEGLTQINVDAPIAGELVSQRAACCVRHAASGGARGAHCCLFCDNHNRKTVLII